MIHLGVNKWSESYVVRTPGGGIVVSVCDFSCLLGAH